MKKNPTASDMGKVGGPARAKALTPERRQEIARKAATARWGDRNGTVSALAEPPAPSPRLKPKAKKVKA